MPFPPLKPSQTYRGTQSHRTGLASVLDPSMGSTPREYEAFLMDQIRRGNKAIVDAIRNDRVRRDLQYRIMQRFNNDNRQVEMEGWEEGYGSSGARGRGEWSENIQRASAGAAGDTPQRWRYLKVVERAREEAERLYGKTPEIQQAERMYGGTPEAGRIAQTPKMGQSSPPLGREKLASRISTRGGLYSPGMSPSMGNIATRAGYGYQKTQTAAETTFSPRTESPTPSPFQPFEPEGRAAGRASILRQRQAARGTVSFNPLPSPEDKVNEASREFYERANARYADPSWQVLQNKVAVEKGYKCAVCGSTHGLDLHHHTYDRLGHETTNDVDFLCQMHHKGDERGLHEYLYKRGLSLRQASKGLVKRGIDPYTGLYLEGAEYLDVKVPFGSYEGKSIQELPGSYLARLEGQYEWVARKAQGSWRYKSFLAAWTFSMNQTWYKSAVAPYHEIYTNLSPADALQFDPYHPDNIHPMTPSFKGSDMWGGKGEAGVVYSGMEYQRIPMKPGELGQTNYGQMPGALRNLPGISLTQPKMPLIREAGEREYEKGIEYITPYRYRGMGEYRDLFPSRAHERRMIREYDPEKRISQQRREFWNQLGGMPDLGVDPKTGEEYGRLIGGITGTQRPKGGYAALRQYTKSMEMRGSSESEIREFKEWWIRKFSTYTYSGAKSILQGEIARLYQAKVAPDIIREYQRRWVERYAAMASPLVEQMEISASRGFEMAGKALAQPGGPDLITKEERTRETGTAAGEEERRGAIEQLALWGESPEASMKSRTTADFGIGKRGRVPRGFQEIDPTEVADMDPEVLMQHIDDINSSQTQEALDEVWNNIVEKHSRDPSLPAIRKVVLERGGFFNGGMSP